jgi:hypothetical protein
MKGMTVVAVLLLASAASAQGRYTGICFLDAILNGLDTVSTKVHNLISPTTTTTSTTSTSTTSTSTTSTSTTEPTSTTTTMEETTTTTTVFSGACIKTDDCKPSETVYTCDMNNNIMVSTINYVCINPGPASECKGRVSTPRIHKPCRDNLACVKGLDECVKK